MPGEVVYDSIIQNKSKIKSYWEQLMLAAELASHPAPVKTSTFQHHYSSSSNNNNNNNTGHNNAGPQHHNNNNNSHVTGPQHPAHAPAHAASPDLSDAEYYDALSQVPPQSPDPTEKDGEKVNETVVERDIRLQQQRELALMIERQRAIKSAKEKARMREKEEEAYLSIPTTDEGNFSEYGSEDKEDHSPDDSRVTSPLVPVDLSLHRRTQSLDSMSSGHSSGSGTVEPAHPITPVHVTAHKPTFGPVKPLDEPEDVDIIRYAKESLKPQTTKQRDDKADSHQLGYEKETPIEREIRLAREREEELRREKRISVVPLADTIPLKSEAEKKKEGLVNVTNKRVTPATQRVQQEIELATEREKELKRWNSDDLQKDMSIKVVSKPSSKKATTTPPPPPPIVQNGDKEVADSQSPKTPNFVKNGGASPKIYIPNPQQKGLMKRFLASRGKMGSSPRLNTLTSPKSPAASTMPSLSPSSLLAEPFFTFTSQVQTKEREESLNLGARPGYKSAEDKIQMELQEMKRREEELRQQRRGNLYAARSQPDLLNIGSEPESEGEVTRLPNTSQLRSALSVHNLLDVDDKPAPRRVPKKKSALIEQWESRIQQKN